MDIEKVFAITDDESVVSSIERVLGKGSDVCRFGDLTEAAENLDFLRPDLVVFHLSDDSDNCDAERLAEMARTLVNRPLLLAVTEDFLPVTHLNLLKLGYTECFARPLDLSRLRSCLASSAASRNRTQKRTSPCRNQSKLLFLPEVGVFSCRSVRLQHALMMAEKVAPRDSPVLIRGETGTGKTLLSALIHKASPRRDQPFVDINCGALPEHLVESELFGHKKGAFTGADSDRVGRFGAAGRGTLFLDEVDTLPPSTQAKLLRVLDQKRFEAVGSNVSQPFQARVIAASNASLEDLVTRRLFRKDLYYRLNVVSIVLPPLRECPDDIRPLAEYHVARLAREYGLPCPELDPSLISAMRQRSWPGNVRELINSVEQMMSLVEGGVLTVKNLPGEFIDTGSSREERVPLTTISGKPLRKARETGELGELLSTLKYTDNNRSLAARLLGISRVTLYKKLIKYGVVFEGGSLVVR